MTAEKYPRGWNQDRVRRVLEHYESQSDEEAAGRAARNGDREIAALPGDSITCMLKARPRWRLASSLQPNFRAGRRFHVH